MKNKPLTVVGFVTTPSGIVNIDEISPELRKEFATKAAKTFAEHLILFEHPNATIEFVPVDAEPESIAL